MKIQPKEALKKAGVNVGGDVINNGEMIVEGKKMPQTSKEVKPEVKPLTEQQKALDFAKEYQALCEKHGYNIVVSPAFRNRDDGTWSIILQNSIGKLPRK